RKPHSNRTRPAQTCFDWLKADSNWTRLAQTGFDRLKQERTRSAQNGLKRVFTGSNRIKPHQTGS
ncbi:hypothetical protein CP02DC21_1758, partial [Chlamydia psittaci 02DC21]